MTVAVRYCCPRCETVVTIERDASLADMSVTPVPLDGWTYDDPGGAFESADGVRFVCGERPVRWDGRGCGEPFYLNFVRFEDGRPVEPAPESELVELADPNAPPSPRGPPGPLGSRRSRW